MNPDGGEMVTYLDSQASLTLRQTAGRQASLWLPSKAVPKAKFIPVRRGENFLKR